MPSMSLVFWKLVVAHKSKACASGRAAVNYCAATRADAASCACAVSDLSAAASRSRQRSVRNLAIPRRLNILSVIWGIARQRAVSLLFDVLNRAVLLVSGNQSLLA